MDVDEPSRGKKRKQHQTTDPAEVSRLYQAGATAAEIADKANIGQSTVQAYIDVFERFQANLQRVTEQAQEVFRLAMQGARLSLHPDPAMRQSVEKIKQTIVSKSPKVERLDRRIRKILKAAMPDNTAVAFMTIAMEALEFEGKLTGTYDPAAPGATADELERAVLGHFADMPTPDQRRLRMMIREGRTGDFSQS